MKINSRSFTAILPIKYKKLIKRKLIAHNLRNLLFIFLTVTVLFQIQMIVVLNSSYNLASKNNRERIEEYQYWENVAGQYPNIPDILYNASISSANAGHKVEALEFVNKALRIDPLFDEALQFKEELLKGKLL